MIRNKYFSLSLDSKAMTEYGYGLLNNVYRLEIPIKNSKDKVKLNIKVDNINSNSVESIEAELTHK
jgi:hypothetical protein